MNLKLFTHPPKLRKEILLHVQSVGDALNDDARSGHQLFERVGHSTPCHQLRYVSRQEQLAICKVMEHRLQRQ